MYGDFTWAKVLAWLVLLYGAVLFVVSLVGSSSFSFHALIMIVIGIGFLKTFKSTSEEFESLRQEMREVRKLLEDNHRTRRDFGG
ncbi:hypothetical protein D7Z26_25225 [Cohnella endophytica]|uniref:Uncharacterized protein n=1 Tax=Cohnella endophytica TaxID=2419778 RepID=A0A494XCJ2_9BACL|nr:hypothetical protein [Cohnella endophytica]RKP45854.1 hypothetical protein D7Z26_25225 [Cohnella endophytica]